MKQQKGKTLIRLTIDSETEVIRDDHTGAFATAYQTKKVGSILVATNIRRENANAFDPICGEVVNGEHAGKTVWFHKLCYREAKAYGNQNHLFKGSDIGQPDGDYLLIEDVSIFFYTVDDRIEMTEEWCLCEPINDVTWEYVDGVKIKCRTHTGGLILPALNEDYKTDRAKLSHVHPAVSERLGINSGDIVYLDKACDLPVEDELNMKLGKIYFRVEVCNILGKEIPVQQNELTLTE